MKEKNYYCDKKVLRELLVKYNTMNYNDDGAWLEKYTGRMKAKHSKGSIDNDKLTNKLDFVTRKRKQIQETREHWDKLTPVERQEYLNEFNKVASELTKNFINIIDGRINSYRLWQHPELADIKQETILALYKYCNRFDSDSDTSPLAYITELVNNAFNLYLQHYNSRNEREISGLDWYENMGKDQKDEEDFPYC